MDKSTITFDKLKEKYEGFHAPECEITIGSKKLKDSEIAITEVEVELAADGTAGGCRITIGDKFDYDSTKWDEKLSDCLEVGEKLIVKLGYIKLEEVFYGFIDDYAYSYSSETGPRLHISGLDGVGYLMGVRNRVFAGKKKIGEFVKEILNDAVSAGAAQKVTVGASLTDMTVQRIMEGEDSYSFLNTVAKQVGASFLCLDGEMIFDDILKTTASLTTLTYGEGLISFTKRLSLANQPGKVIVHGRDVNNEAIKGECTKTTLTGDGKGAAETASKLLQKAVYEEENALVTTADECKTLAENRFNSMALNYVSGEGVCVGLPDLIPGRYIKIDGIDKDSCGSFFVSRVRHILNNDGFYTKFEVKGATSK